MFNSSHECEVSIIVNGRPVTEVQFSGHTYIEGRKNSIYELQIRNKTNNRILAIPSVDGLNVLDGNSCGMDSPGYVIDPLAVVTIPGWKVDNEQAAKFTFKPQKASAPGDKTYVEQMGGDAINQGMIGVMVFKQKIQPTFYTLKDYEPWNVRDNSGNPPPFGPVTYSTSNCCGSMEPILSSAPFIGYADADVGKSLGTGFGEATEFKTQDAEFERATESPDSVFVMYYDTLQGLKKRGVPTEQFRPAPVSTPNPFPASPSVTSGCKPPAGWNSTKYRK